MFSPAKINIGLSVLSRRPSDGYHLIHTIFVPISFGDEIEFEVGTRHSLISSNLLPENERDAFERVSERGNPNNNLILKILHQLDEELKSRSILGIKVSLQKRIPTGGGLGGGSSNAGSLLRYLHTTHHLPLSILRPVAVKSGADVPFFLNPTPSQVGGIGDRIEPIQAGAGLGVLALSGIHVDTALAYKKLKRDLHPNPTVNPLILPVDELRDALINSRWDKITPLKNDFEDVVFDDFPELMNIKRAFAESGSLYSSMSGSGSSLYALVESEEKQQQVITRMRGKFTNIRFEPFRFI